jgi:hypothetical protein
MPAFPGSTNFGPIEVFPGLSLVPVGGLTHYVHASGTSQLDLLPAAVASPTPGGFFTSVNAALGACRTNRGDRIVCLPGHTENIDVANKWSNIVPGVTVLSMGEGTARATFTWNAAAATVLFNQANFGIKNCILQMATDPASSTSVTVAAPITVSAKGCFIDDCFIQWGVAAAQNVTIGITTTAAATDFRFNRNRCYAVTAAAPGTTFLRLTGTDRLEMQDTWIHGPGSSTTIGPVQQLTTAGLGMFINRCAFTSTTALSTIAFTAISGNTGQMSNCTFGVLASGNGITTGSALQFNQSFVAITTAAGVAVTG